VVYVVAALVIGAFFVANWAPLGSVTRINLLFSQVEAPVAFLLLLCIGVILVMNLIAHALSANAWRLERRKLVAELEATRARADREEESRTQALRVTLEREFSAVRSQLDRLLGGDAALVGRRPPEESLPAPSTQTSFEPELVPPHPSPVRGRH
jgi:hypothetical protein